MIVAGVVVLFCLVYFFSGSRNVTPVFPEIGIEKIQYHKIERKIELEGTIKSKAPLTDPVSISLFQGTTRRQEYGTIQPHFHHTFVNVEESFDPYRIVFYYKNRLLHEKEYPLYPPPSLRFERIYQKSPRAIQVEGKLSIPPDKRHLCSFSLMTGQGTTVEQKKVSLPAGFFQLQFTSHEPFSGKLVVQAMEPRSEAFPVEIFSGSVSSSSSEKSQGLPTLISKMATMAALLDASTQKLCDPESTPSSALGQFYREWQQDFQSLSAMHPQNDGNPLQLRRVKTFYEALKQLAETIIKQHDTAPPARKKEFLNHLSDPNLNQMLSLLLELNRIIRELDAQAKAEPAMPFLETWLKNLEIGRFRARCHMAFQMFRQQNKIQQAFLECEKLLRILPDDWTMLWARCGLYWDLGKEDLAKKDWIAAQKAAAQKSQTKLLQESIEKVEKDLFQKVEQLLHLQKYAQALRMLEFLGMLNPGRKEIKAKIAQVKRKAEGK